MLNLFSTLMKELTQKHYGVLIAVPAGYLPNSRLGLKNLPKFLFYQLSSDLSGAPTSLTPHPFLTINI
jgi:hypothetical protein